MSLKSIVITALLLAIISTGTYFFLQYQFNTEISRYESLMLRGQYNDIINPLQPAVSQNSAEPRERELYAEALYRSGDFDAVDPALEPLLMYGEETPQSLTVSAFSNLKRNEYLLAHERFSRLEQEFPDYTAMAQSGKGAVALIRSERFRRKDLEEAERLLTQYTKEANSADAHLYLTEYYLITHNYSKAVDEAVQASAMQPYWAEPYVVLGRCYLQDGKYSKAEEAFQQSLEYGASETTTNYYLARSMYQQGRLNESLEVFLGLTSGDTPTAVKATEDAARIYVVLGQLNEAVQLLEPYAQQLINPGIAMQLFEIHSRLGNHGKAAVLLQNIIKKWPLSNDAQLELGSRQLIEGKWKEANRTLLNVTDDDPNHFWANYNLGCIAVQQGQLNQAPDYFESASEDSPDFFAAKVNRAISLLAVDRSLDGRMLLQELYYAHEKNPVIMLAQALERFLAGFPEVSLQRINQSLAVLHEQAVPYLIRGEIFLRLYQFEQAKENYQKALEIEPNNTRAQIGMAHVSFRLGDYHNADTFYNKLLLKQNELTQPVLFEVLNGTALLKAANNDYTGALDIWDDMKFKSPLGRQFSLINRNIAPGYTPSAIELDDLKTGMGEEKVLPELFFNIGVLSKQTGDRNTAINMYDRLTKEYPTFLPAFFNIASINEETRRYPTAVFQYETAQKAAPTHIDILNNLAAVQVYTGDLNQAQKQLTTAAELEEGNPIIEANRVLVDLQQTDIDRAKEKFKTLTSIVGNAPVAQSIQGLFEAQEGDWDEALNQFSSARQNGDRNAYTFINNAVALAKQNKMTEAEDLLLQAKAMEPNNPGVYKALGMFYSQIGLYTDAKTALERSLSIDPNQRDAQQILDQINKWMS